MLKDHKSADIFTELLAINLENVGYDCATRKNGNGYYGITVTGKNKKTILDVYDTAIINKDRGYAVWVPILVNGERDLDKGDDYALISKQRPRESADTFIERLLTELRELVGEPLNPPEKEE